MRGAQNLPPMIEGVRRSHPWHRRILGFGSPIGHSPGWADLGSFQRADELWNGPDFGCHGCVIRRTWSYSALGQRLLKQLEEQQVEESKLSKDSGPCSVVNRFQTVALRRLAAFKLPQQLEVSGLWALRPSSSDAKQLMVTIAWCCWRFGASLGALEQQL